MLCILVLYVVSLPIVCGGFLADTDVEDKLKSYNKKYGLPMPYVHLIFFFIVCMYPIILVSLPFVLLFKIIYSLVVNFKDFKKSIVLIIKEKVSD